MSRQRRTQITTAVLVFVVLLLSLQLFLLAVAAEGFLAGEAGLASPATIVSAVRHQPAWGRAAVSELVTNALQHETLAGHGARIGMLPGRARIEVHDAGHEVPGVGDGDHKAAGGDLSSSFDLPATESAKVQRGARPSGPEENGGSPIPEQSATFATHDDFGDGRAAVRTSGDVEQEAPPRISGRACNAYLQSGVQLT